MPELFSTKYANNSRAISGTSNVINKDDTILLCNTTSGAVAVTIGEIPNGFWDTNYKLYISDYSNNAGTNNITINAPSGFTINNASSLVISTNGGSVLIQIASSTAYVGNLNYCCNTKQISFYEANAILTDIILPIDNNKNNLLASLLLTITGETSTLGERYIINTNLNRFRFTISPTADNGTMYLVSIVTNELDVVQETNRQAILIFNGYGASGNVNSLMLNWMPVTPLKVGWKIKTYINVSSIANDVEVKFENTSTAFSQCYATRTKLL